MRRNGRHYMSARQFYSFYKHHRSLLPSNTFLSNYQLKKGLTTVEMLHQSISPISLKTGMTVTSVISFTRQATLNYYLWLSFWTNKGWVCITPRSYFAFNKEELLERACKEEDVLLMMNGRHVANVIRGLMRLPVWRDTVTPAPVRVPFFFSWIWCCLFPLSNAWHQSVWSPSIWTTRVRIFLMVLKTPRSIGKKRLSSWKQDYGESRERLMLKTGLLVKRHWRLPRQILLLSDPTLSPCHQHRKGAFLMPDCHVENL